MPTFKRADQEQLEKAKDLLEAHPEAEPGFAKSLFFGRVKLDEVLPYPKQAPEEAQRTNDLLARLGEFLKAEVDADDIDVHERIPKKVIDGLGKLGVLGMTVPTQYGGGGFSHTAYCRVIERIAGHCASTGVLVGAHQSIGLKALVLMGNEQQKQYFLPRLASGEILAAFCLSEPEVGSDAANVQTRATLAPDGKTWILNGGKKFATNAALAGMMTVMAKTPVTENGKTRDKVTAFIVTPDLPGFEVVSPNRSKCGVRGTWQATLRFNDMAVPQDRILGQLGKGLKVALSVLDYGRCTVGAGCVGGAKELLRRCVDRVKNRQQFGRSISEFHLIKEKIARMAQTTFAMDALTYLAAGLVDRHSEDMMLETAIAKLFCSEGLWQIADDAVSIWAGEGYMRENGIERGLRDARINRIVEGTTEVMTAFVALIGMKGVGEQFESILRAGKRPVKNFGRLARFARDQWRDIVIGAEISGLHPQLESEGHALARLTNQLAKEVSRLLRTYRQDILDMQLLQQRIAWSAVELYAMAAVISKLQSMLEAAGSNGHANGNGNGHGNGHGNGNGHHDLHRDLLIGKGYCRQAVSRITQRLSSLFTNQDASILQQADAILGTGAALG
jgi:alkylation response protein AidB-like acyl-CoA dehydrogenase